MLTGQEMKKWQSRNSLLQQAYNQYLFASTQKEKDTALNKIKYALEWEPFMNICLKHDALIFGITRYGLDYQTEICIGLIDKISKGEIKLDQ